MREPRKRNGEDETQRDTQRFSEGDKRKSDEENPEDDLCDAPEPEDAGDDEPADRRTSEEEQRAR